MKLIYIGVNFLNYVLYRLSVCWITYYCNIYIALDLRGAF